jgi:hypothetical protein
METSDVLVLMTATSGLILIVGGLLLLLRGAISLTREPNTEGGGGAGLGFQLQGIKLTTDYPAIGIFAIGLLFFGLGVWSEAQQTDSITITGRLENISPREADVYAAVPLIPVMSKPDGTIDYQLAIRPHTDVWAVVITPGRDPVMNMDSAPLRRTFGSVGRADFEDLPVGQPARSMPPASTIEPVRAPLPGLTELSGLKP